MARELDYAPLARRLSLRDRLSAVRASNIWVYSMTLGAFLTVLPALVLVGVIPMADMSDPGFIVLMAMLVAAGVFVVVSVLYQVGGDGALGAFALANDLELTQGSTVTHYAGSSFVDGTFLVHRSVRTRGAMFLGVGDTFPVGAGTRSQERRPEVFLRVGVAGPLRPHATAGDLVGAELDTRLRQWAGRYVVEWADHELTLHGGRPLGATDPDRVRQGFELADRLRSRAADLVVAPPDDTAQAPTPSGVPIPTSARRQAPVGRPRRPLAVVAWTLAFLVLGPLVIALAMSTVEEALQGRPVLVTVVVGLLVAGLVAAARALVRGITSPSRRANRPS